MAPYDFRLLPLLPEIHNSCTWTHISEEQTLKKKFKFSFKFLLKVGVNPSASDIPPSLEFPANGYTSKFTLEITLQLATYQSCQTLLKPPPLLPIYPSPSPGNQETNTPRRDIKGRVLRKETMDVTFLAGCCFISKTNFNFSAKGPTVSKESPIHFYI